MRAINLNQNAAAIPHGWYYVARSKDIPQAMRKPLSFYLGQRELIAFRANDGQVSVLDGRCCHFGAHLSNGKIVNGCIECPLHGWQFDSKGECKHIPVGENVPNWARQQTYKTVERLGLVFFHYGSTINFEVPGFDGIEDTELLPASPIFFDVDCPWYMIGANAFDYQHFRTSHDRLLLEEPVVEAIGNYERRIKLRLKILQNTLVDKLMAVCAGEVVEMAINNIGGNFITVTSSLKHSSTYAYTNVIPVSKNKCRIVNIVMVKRSNNKVAQIFFDPINSLIRRELIRRFLASDQGGISGSDIVATHCIHADREIKEYFSWIKEVTRTSISNIE